MQYLYDTAGGIVYGREVAYGDGKLAKADKLLAAMRENPKDNWRIEQMATVGRRYGVDVAPPKRGSHYTATHPDLPDIILTIPRANPVKSVYVKQFVSMLDDIIALEEDEATEGSKEDPG